VNLDTLVTRGEALHADLGRESYLTGAGLKSEPTFQAIYQRYRDLQGDEAVAVARASCVAPLLEWVVDLRVGRRVAAHEDRQLIWEQQAVLRVDGREVPYLRAAIELQNAPDRAWRIALDRARAAAGAAGLNALRRERFQTEREVVLAFELGADYVAAISALSGIDLIALDARAATLLAETRELYDDALARLVRRRLGLRIEDLMRADTGWAFRADQFDAAFPPDALVPLALRQMAEMGLDATAQGRVRFDTEERPGKQPRAFCAPVRVPDEVYVVLRPSGGHTDYRTFWHELGHAMHFAAVDPGRPFHERWLGDNSVTEGFAMLWDHLTLDPGWMARYSRLGERVRGGEGEIRELLFELAVGELYMLRRYAAKLHYEIQLHRGDYEHAGPLYAELLTDATRFRFPEEDFLRDVDPGFYAARYLRAWQLAAMLGERLVERFDEDWYRNPRAGAFVRDLMARGQADSADRLAEHVAGGPLAFAPLIRRLTTVLA
jgi:hypothetical protein